MKDEDYAYEVQRQRELDDAREIRIGSQVFLMNDYRRPMCRMLHSVPEPQFAKGVELQRFQTHDPDPHVPFVTPAVPFFRNKLEAGLYGFAWGFAIGVVVML